MDKALTVDERLICFVEYSAKVLFLWKVHQRGHPTLYLTLLTVSLHTASRRVDYRKQHLFPGETIRLTWPIPSSQPVL
ncbi:MAG: hypothetical protein HYU39_08810 [Thaumarchaeota archaeon]|nr:hypothetical protein [Nitrososphaerota archaeon]